VAENSKIEWTDRVCELEDELAAVRAELERALVVVQAAVAYAKADGPEAMMPLLSLEHAVSAWKAGRCVLAGDAADALRAALAEAEKAEPVAWLRQDRPSVLFRPHLSIDGNQWCALYGDNLQDGVAGFGDSPEAAMRDFDQAWGKKLEAGR
jgi:hypothetical protein